MEHGHGVVGEEKQGGGYYLDYARFSFKVDHRTKAETGTGGGSSKGRQDVELFQDRISKL